jgi:hypothetical protein
MPPLLANHATITLAARDGRTRQARLVRLVRRELEQQCGGSPSVVQRLLIERVAQISLVLADLDAQAAIKPLQGDDLTNYLSLHGHLTRAIERLGIKPPKPVVSTQSDTVAALLERLSA